MTDKINHSYNFKIRSLQNVPKNVYISFSNLFPSMHKQYFSNFEKISLPEITRASFGLQVINLILKQFILVDLFIIS